MIKLRKTIKPLPGIYGIKNIITKRIYIGSAENIRMRLSSHFSFLNKNKHPNKELQQDFNIYSYDNFICIVFKYKPKKKTHSEATILRLLLNNNIPVYNYTMPDSNNKFKPMTRNTTKYILKQTKLKRTYTNVQNLKQFYEHNKVYGCPNPTKLYEMVLDKSEFRNWTIEIDADNAEEIIQHRRGKKGCKPIKHVVYYTRLINWKITNVLTKKSIIVPNLMAWCRTNNIHYNQFQRYQNVNRTYKGIWKLKKI